MAKKKDFIDRLLEMPLDAEDLTRHPVLTGIFELKTSLNSLKFAYIDILEPEKDSQGNIVSTILDKKKAEVKEGTGDTVIKELEPFKAAIELNKIYELLLKLEKRNFTSALNALNKVLKYITEKSELLKGFVKLKDDDDIKKVEAKSEEGDDIYS